jgi:hypothetical protein
MGCAKFSSAFLLERVSPQSPRKKLVLYGLITLWIVYSLLAIAFRCGLPTPWIYDHGCSHGGPLCSVIAFNMATDIMLAVWIFPTLRTLNMDRGRRIAVGALFGSRGIVALASIPLLYVAIKLISKNGQDPTWNSVDLAVVHQAVTSLSLMVASLPRIKRFLGTAGSGLMRPTIQETELAQSTRAGSASASRTGNEPLKLIPSNSTKFTTTVWGKQNNKNKAHADWYKFMSMGSKEDEHTSTSSLFDKDDDADMIHNGVMRHQEVTVKISRPDDEARPG